jgi:phage terminase large subunit-like protein
VNEVTVSNWIKPPVIRESQFRDLRSLPVRDLTRGERMVKFIETFCCAPEGDGAGQPIRLDPFQKQFILDVYDNPVGTNLGILSIAKKNGKSSTIAALMLGHLVGPEARLNSQIVAGAMSREQASIIFKYAAKIVRFSPRLVGLIKIVDSRKQMYGLRMNVEFVVKPAVAKSTQGISPVMAIIDEAGQVRGPRSEFIDAITTAQGAYDDALLFIISTQAASDADYLSVEIDRAPEDPHTVCHVYEAPEKPDVMDEAAWKAANPALGTFRSKKDMRKLAAKAKNTPAFVPTFRNLNLNQRVETTAPLFSRDVWNLGNRDLVPYEGQDVYAGLDLSAVNDLTAFVWIYQAGGQWNCGAAFWTPTDGLRERAQRDKEPYDVWANQGLIHLTPGPTVDPDYVAAQIIEMTSQWNLKALAYDMWRIESFKAAMQRKEAPTDLVEKLVPFGQGFKSMSPAIDHLEREALKGTIAHAGNPVLRMCARNAKVRKDEAGNRKLDKMKSIGRIDGMTGLVQAAGAANDAMNPAEERTFEMFFLGASPTPDQRAKG